MSASEESDVALTLVIPLRAKGRSSPTAASGTTARRSWTSSTTPPLTVMTTWCGICSSCAGEPTSRPPSCITLAGVRGWPSPISSDGSGPTASARRRSRPCFFQSWRGRRRGSAAPPRDRPHPVHRPTRRGGKRPRSVAGLAVVQKCLRGWRAPQMRGYVPFACDPAVVDLVDV